MEKVQKEIILSYQNCAKILPIFPDIDNQRSMIHIDNLSEFSD